MSITKGAHDQDHSLFAQNLLINEAPSPCNSYQQHKTSPSPRHHDEQSPHDFQPVVSHISPSQLRFYQEYKKIYMVSHHLSLQKARQMMVIDSLSKRIRSLQEKMRDINQKMNTKKDQISDQNRTKRSRRTAEEIQKKYKCEVEFCQRLYGSEGSLQQHIKLKHPELYHKSHSEDSIMPRSHDSFL